MYRNILTSPSVMNYISRDAFRRLSSTVRPEIPKCLIQGKHYEGPSYEKIQDMRSSYLPFIRPFYRKPLVIHEGKMQWLFDHTGKRYLDMFGGIVTVSVGHCHPKVTAVVKEQMAKLWHTTTIYMNPELYVYAEKLVSKFPGNLKAVYFVNSGSEANDLAVFLARLYTQHYDIISLRNSYHGMSPYMMGVTSLSTWKYPVATSSGIHHAMNPDVYRGIWGGKKCRDSPVQTNRPCSCENDYCEAANNYYNEVEEIFKYSLPKRKVAGFIAESIQGVGGTVQFPKGYLKRVYDLVHDNGGVCIADEVQTGFGRTGDHFWGFQMHGVQPDIVTLAKGIGNGFPLAAVVTTPQIASSISQAQHFNTFGGNPLASAAGLAVLQVIEEENTQYNSKIVGTYLLNCLGKLREEFDCIGDVRGKGLMIGIEMVQDKERKIPMNNESISNIWEDCKDMGLLIGKGGLHGNVFRLKPPMCITQKDADFTIEVIYRAMKNHMTKDIK